MKKTLVIALLALASIPAFADNWTFNQFGNIGRYQSTDGSWYSTNRFGNTTNWSGFDSSGQYHSGFFTRFGNNVYGFGN